MRHLPLLHLASIAGLAMVVAGCGSATEPPEEPASTPAVTTETPRPTASPTQSPTGPIATVPPGPGGLERVTVTGVLEEGVESGCVVLTDEESGQVYTVTGRGLPERIGQRVTVTGTVDPDMVSYCQQGAILLVDEVTPAP